MYKKYLKRTIDIIVSLIVILLLFPVFLVIAILIKFDSEGPIIFKHKRLGKNCKAIYVWKFRTMVKNAEKLGPNFTVNSDTRVTNIGKKLRDLSLDELPQLVNILKGDMSLIGPRPDAYTKEPDEYQIKRTEVLPGITGLAQVNGRSNISIEKRKEYDVYYVKDYSFLMDLNIFIKTFLVVLKKDGVN